MPRYDRQLMRAILHGRLPIADIAEREGPARRSPSGHQDLDEGAAVECVLDPHNMPRAARNGRRVGARPAALSP